MVFEPLFNSKGYEFKTPALRRLNDRLINLDLSYRGNRYDEYTPLRFPLAHRIRVALLIILGP